MTTVTKIIEWDMGHRVPNHKSKCRNPHGHRYRLEATIGGPLINTEGSSDEGMVIDFSDIKKIMTEEIHDKLDHGFMYFEDDWIMKEFFEEFGPHRDWSEDFLSIPVQFIPTAEEIARWCYNQIARKLPDPLFIDSVKLFETPNSWAVYDGTP